jgi:hypothetical protein
MPAIDVINVLLADSEKRKRIEERFWSKVQVNGPDECWPWIAKAKHRFGYGLFTIATGIVVYSHRLSFSLAGKKLGKDEQVRHSCDYSPCCNPQHLLPGTQADNVKDMMDRGRHVARPNTPEIRRKISEGMRANPTKFAPHILQSRADQMRKRWEDPEWRKKMLTVCAKGKGRKLTGKAIQNIRDGVARREAKRNGAMAPNTDHSIAGDKLNAS